MWPNGERLLFDRLQAQLPGLAMAVDKEYAAPHLERVRLDGDSHRLKRIQAHMFWYRTDGTCTLRYKLGLTNAGGDESEATVLGRVHRDAGAAAAYVDAVLSTAASEDRNDASVQPRRALVATESGLTLHPFPVDPELPTLEQAVDASQVAKLLPARSVITGTRNFEPCDVDVIHHPREGACVLRYRQCSQVAPSSWERAGSFYGKVYGDAERGAGVARLLEELSCAAAVDATSAQLPQPLSYVPSLRLLIMHCLPGRPVLPELLKAAAPGSQASPWPDTLSAIVGAAGRSLAEFHRLRVRPGTAYRDLAGETDRLHRELATVAMVWPESAQAIRRRLNDRLGEVSGPASRMVLCHGDYTPGQILVDAGRYALVDLDDACFSEPALDLGCFLAHTDMVAAKARGPSCLTQLEALAAVFLQAYEEHANRPVDRAFRSRIAAFRSLTLARTAARSCRQLKPERLAAALLLLDQVPNWTAGGTS